MVYKTAKAQPCSGKLKMLLDSGNEGYNATQNLHTSSWDMWHPLFPDQTIFTSIYPLLNTFATKFYLRSETYVSYKFYAGYHQKGDFLDFLFVRRKRHARFRSVFFIKSWWRKTLHIQGIGSISDQIGFALKIALKINLVRCPKFHTHKVTLCGIVLIYYI